MRWPVYFIFAYFMLGLQVGVSRYIAFHGATPNLGLIAALFIALNARRETALLACFAIGFLQDLLSEQQPGLFAIAYGLMAMLVVETHQSVNGNRAVKQFSFALVGGLLTTVVLLVHSGLHPAGEAAADGKIALAPVRISAGVEFTRAVYTAVLAPIILGGLNRIRGLFAFVPLKRKTRFW
ncbi:MAG TPA: rod shape-determining protein MreD [Tepidisphaeraceae bacterium]|jgi:rod shape-determining protein MreD|nr:rod shape-determining protein MreD [Tepidisphaeraceae bacterium]